MTALRFEHAFGEALLARRPDVAGGALQAWDGADALLLETLHAKRGIGLDGPVLVINDSFGALAIAVAPAAGHGVTSWSDSRVAHLALQENRARNPPIDALTNAPTAPIVCVPATETPSDAPTAVLWRVPKSLPLLQQQVARLRPLLRADTLVLAGGMDKHLPAQAEQLLAALGTVQRLPGRRKAHVFVVTPDLSRATPPEPPPVDATIGELGLQLRGDANVFASGQLGKNNIDIGARFFIDQFGKLPAAGRIADLGCGNGLLGIVAQRRFPDAALSFFDESYQAVAAARANYVGNIAPRPATAPPPLFVCDDGLSHYNGPAFDLVLCNPPFHQGHTVGDHVARALLKQARQQLRPGGELWIVGNRHLRYEQVLKQLFGGSRRIADNPKFSVLAATRRG